MENNHGTPLDSRKAKATSVVLGDPSTEILRKPHLSPARRLHPVKRNHNSLPADLAYSLDEDADSFHEAAFSSELFSIVKEEKNDVSFATSPMSRIAAFRKELDLLKGCVSECSTMFSSSTSPDVTLLEEFDSTAPRPPPLPVDEPFKILSSSAHVVLPMEEYSIQVPVLEQPFIEECDVLERIDTEFSVTELDIFSDENFTDFEESRNQSCETISSETPSSSSDSVVKLFSRQGSLEYDHLEPGFEKESRSSKNSGTSNASNKTDSASNTNNNNYSVTVQFHETNEPAEVQCTAENANLQNETDVDTTTNRSASMQAAKSLLTLSAVRNMQLPLEKAGNTSYSIPEKLNSEHVCLKTFTKTSPLHIPTKPPVLVLASDGNLSRCHCPVCCSCGSANRPLNDYCVCERKPSSASQQQYYDDAMSNASWPICPLERYSTFPSSVVSRKKEVPMPAVSVSQGVSRRIDRVSSGNDNLGKRFGSSVEISHSNSVIEGELEISSNYGNQVCSELDNQSIFSIHSLTSCQSGWTSHSYCSISQPYNKGVEGSVFKERIELISQWFTEFSDQQRNSMLQQLLSLSNCSQMHMLSLEMEPILHQCCPHNCQDLLSWLPPGIVLRIMSFLDPVSLCRASQVSKVWYTMANDPLLWKRLTLSRNWQMSFGAHTKQLDVFTSGEGEVEWKLMFAERFRLRRNWLKGYCTVRTFEGHSQGISCVQFDDTRIVSGSWDKTIKVWNRRTNTAWAALTLSGHSGTVRCLHLHGNRLVSGSSDRTIKVWDLATNNVNWVGAACKATMVGHLHTVRCLKADDSKVVSGSYDHTLKIWDIKTGTCTKTLRGHRDAVLCLQFDNEKVVSGSKDTTIKVWHFNNGQCKHTLHGHEGAVSCLQFDDNRIISGALDRLIKIWNLTTGQCVRTIDWIKSEGHTGVVRHLQADDWKMVSAADDKTMKVWSLQSGERLLTLRSHTDGVTCLQFNDQVIVSGSYDKTVKLWDFSVC